MPEIRFFCVQARLGGRTIPAYFHETDRGPVIMRRGYYSKVNRTYASLNEAVDALRQQLETDLLELNRRQMNAWKQMQNRKGFRAFFERLLLRMLGDGPPEPISKEIGVDVGDPVEISWREVHEIESTTWPTCNWFEIRQNE